MNVNEISINWKGRQMDYNPSVFYIENINEFEDEDSDYTSFMELYQEFNNDDLFVQEGFSDKLKKFFSKAIELIKRFFSFIGKQITRLFNFLFRRKHPKKTADQIASSIISSSVQEVSWEEFNKQKDSEKVHFPSAPGSAIKETDVELITKELLITIENNNYVMGPVHGLKGSENAGPQDVYKVLGKKTADSQFHLSCFLAFSSNNNGYRDNLIQCIDWLLGAQNDSFEDLTPTNKKQLIENQRYMYQKISHSSSLSYRYSWSSKLLLESQKSVNDVMSKLAKLNTIDDDKMKSPEYKTFLSEIVAQMQNIMTGCNQYARHVKAMYMIDKKYLHSINDIDTLSKFVSSMIEAGIPSTQVAYNTWCVMNKNLSGVDYFASEEKGPLWGQTRVVFLPDTRPTDVLKIALNAGGLFANKREKQIYDQYEKANLSSLLAKPVKMFENNSIIVMEKLSTNGVSRRDVDEIKRKIDDACDRNDLLHKIGDVHIDNVGFRSDGTCACFDYAG